LCLYFRGGWILPKVVFCCRIDQCID
jgi:hypothetical protein